jgi:hypothetical protein
VHVLNVNTFCEFGKIECRSYDSITPIEVVEVTLKDLPKSLKLISL